MFLTKKIRGERMTLINADALREKWCENCSNIHLCGDKDWCDEVRELYDMPVIEAEPVKHGHWRTMVGEKMVDYEQEIYRRYYVHYCSICHKASAVKRNYCPNCGAKMS